MATPAVPAAAPNDVLQEGKYRLVVKVWGRYEAYRATDRKRGSSCAAVIVVEAPVTAVVLVVVGAGAEGPSSGDGGSCIRDAKEFMWDDKQFKT